MATNESAERVENILDTPLTLAEQRNLPSVRGDYVVEWRRFMRRLRLARGVGRLLQLMFFGAVIFDDDIGIGLDYENPVLDRRPIKDGKSKADNGSRNRAERMLGAKALIRASKHERVDAVLTVAAMMRGFGMSEDEVFDFIAVEESDLNNVVVDEQLLNDGEIVDLMSVDLVEEHTCSAAPIGDLWGEQLPWGSMNVVLVGHDDDNQPLVEVVYKSGKKLSGTLKGGAEKYQRWADHKSFTLEGVKEARITRDNKAAVQGLDRARVAVDEALTLIRQDEVPEPRGTRGRPRLVWVVLSALGSIGQPNCLSWIGRYGITDQVLEALAERADEVAELLPVGT